MKVKVKIAVGLTVTGSPSQREQRIETLFDMLVTTILRLVECL